MKHKEEKELVGVKEIARRANVSIATVDRVLHNRSGVSLKTKEKIEAIIADLDYKPNVFARRLASKKILRLAVLIPQVSNETAFWQAPLEGIAKAQEEIRNYGITVENFLFDLNDISTFEKYTKVILESEFDGVLVAPVFINESTQFANKCQKLKIPYVFINSDIPNQDSLCYIGPNLYQSGYMGAHLLSYILSENSKILLINISKEIDTHHHLLRKEEGFRGYFAENNKSYEVVKIDIRQTDYESVEKQLNEVFSQQKDIKALFVTNSRVSSVAKYIQEHKLQHLLLLGFDFLPQNIDFLKKNVIDFLICQKPQEQGYKAIIALYNKLVHNINTEKINFMPIDIISRENFMFY
ncbi:LacI family DNA-binding transcriptional regulator [Pedobacter arcticus]|uniref:LacI family DNA-binding transcriptional regulator n=1 Tax=Pedobacter arcticus TaxID=752140 RepID=UPI0002EF8658|nr:substrate-binding domain-containing protein [Pedobacter arcticus]